MSNNAGYKYKKTCEELLEEYKKNNWMDEDNDLINPSTSDSYRLDADIFIDDEEENKINYKLLYKQSQKKIEELENKLKSQESSLVNSKFVKIKTTKK